MKPVASGTRKLPPIIYKTFARQDSLKIAKEHERRRLEAKSPLGVTNPSDSPRGRPPLGEAAAELGLCNS